MCFNICSFGVGGEGAVFKRTCDSPKVVLSHVGDGMQGLHNLILLSVEVLFFYGRFCDLSFGGG